MTTSLCLTPDELYDLTYYKRTATQMKALNQMRIDYLIRPDGTIAVFRHALPGFTAEKIIDDEEKLVVRFGE